LISRKTDWLNKNQKGEVVSLDQKFHHGISAQVFEQSSKHTDTNWQTRSHYFSPRWRQRRLK